MRNARKEPADAQKRSAIGACPPVGCSPSIRTGKLSTWLSGTLLIVPAASTPGIAAMRSINVRK
jgi:hypothetical protein